MPSNRNQLHAQRSKLSVGLLYFTLHLIMSSNQLIHRHPLFLGHSVKPITDTSVFLNACMLNPLELNTVTTATSTNYNLQGQKYEKVKKNTI